ncbi:MAG TPA: hypothetical protein VN924_15280 [Bryobacteraceae bacterium]|jgi:hypothetical protein|nr:hypothetical protein [Bryobacteraceae bacterium]
MSTLPRSAVRLLSVAIAAGFAVVVMAVAVSCSKRGIVKGPSPPLQPPDSVFILAKGARTADKIVQAFQTVADGSKYSVSVWEAVAAPKAVRIPPTSGPTGATSEAYYLVSTYGNAPLASMVLLQNYAVAADRFGLSTIVGNDADDDNTSVGGVTNGGTTFTTGATNNNGKLGESLKGGIVGVGVVEQVRQTLNSINPSLYQATYFNSLQVGQHLQNKPSPSRSKGQ